MYYCSDWYNHLYYNKTTVSHRPKNIIFNHTKHILTFICFFFLISVAPNSVQIHLIKLLSFTLIYRIIWKLWNKIMYFFTFCYWCLLINSADKIRQYREKQFDRDETSKQEIGILLRVLNIINIFLWLILLFSNSFKKKRLKWTK